MKKSLLISLVVIVALGAYFGRWAWRAKKDLVTLQVNNMPLSDVVRKLRWQTWEDIHLNKDVTGWVTLNVENATLDTVFRVLDEQISGRCDLVYALYRSSKSLSRFENLLDGKLAPPVVGWTNWNARPDFAMMRTLMENTATQAQASATNNPDGTPSVAPDGTAVAPADATAPPGGMGGFGGGGFGGSFGGGVGIGSAPITVAISDQEIAPAIFMMRRATRARIVAEDGTFGRVTLALNQIPVDEAVTKLGKQVNRKVAKYYSIEPRRMPQFTEEDRQQMSQVQRPNREGMRQRFEEMAQNPDFQNRMIERRIQSLKTTTPEQRAQRGRGFGRGGGGGGRGGR